MKTDPSRSNGAPSDLTGALLDWYALRRRPFPWRERATPYRIWVSEIMLQQTRIEAALPYFERFMAALPTVDALARVPEDRLMKLWEGLGYYSRARNLQKAARVLVRDCGGELPASFEALRALPGVGEYTAGAIASIAFGLRVPAVDGNVLRVAARLTNDGGDVMKAPARRRLTETVKAMLPPDRPGDFNEALMELGETVCLPHAVPLCGGCPLAAGCAARKEGHPERLPVRTPPKKRKSEERTVLILTSRGQVLLRRREPKGLLAGLWELPGAEGRLDEASAAAATAAWGLSPAAGFVNAGEAKHIFSHVEWRMYGLRAEVPPCKAPEGFAWADARSLREDRALPSAFRAYAARLPEWLSESMKED